MVGRPTDFATERFRVLGPLVPLSKSKFFPLPFPSPSFTVQHTM